MSDFFYNLLLRKIKSTPQVKLDSPLCGTSIALSLRQVAIEMGRQISFYNTLQKTTVDDFTATFNIARASLLLTSARQHLYLVVVQNNPGSPFTPRIPGIPGAPGIPGKPGRPSIPGGPGSPSRPRIPGIPGGP